MYQAIKHQDNGDLRLSEKFYNLYADIMMARGLCQYGHLDNFSFEKITQAREKAKRLSN